jgi:hypothetical protein
MAIFLSIVRCAHRFESLYTKYGENPGDRDANGNINIYDVMVATSIYGQTDP